MANLIYMESAFNKERRLGVVHCEVVMPGMGQSIINKAVKNTTRKKLSLEKLHILTDLLQNGVPTGAEKRYKLRRADVTVYSNDPFMLEAVYDSACGECCAPGEEMTDACDKVWRVAATNGYHLMFEQHALLQKTMYAQAKKYLRKQEEMSDGTTRKGA